VLFVGEGETIRAIQISNRRWAMSALGTASVAALRAGDTIYSLAPLHHSSALLSAAGGAIAGGARFAVASERDPATFWAEVRRYGATHVSYTWTALRQIALGPPDPAERHHPIRMFLGSGMPSNLWRRVMERYPGTRIVEFYASAEGSAILANPAGLPVGSLGRPIPDTPQVRLAAFDQQARALAVNNHGLLTECEPGEVGLLLAQVDPTRPDSGNPLRSVFTIDDAWQSTGDLFRRDEQGEFWLVDPASALITTCDGVIAPGHARTAMEAVPAVDLVVAYGVPNSGTRSDLEVLVVAVTLRSGTELDADELDRAFDSLPTRLRPSFVQVVEDIPVTAWGRPQAGPLRKMGLPVSGRSRSWRLDAETQRYRPN
jgi:putative long chain acyl-CoA synthase